jgi:hypothetical protein
MAIRVLARIPEIAVERPAVVCLPTPPEVASNAPGLAAAPGPAASQPARPLLPTAAVRRPRAARPARSHGRARMPLASILALALVTLGIWSLVAYREADRREADRPPLRLAAAPEESPVIAPETTLR